MTNQQARDKAAVDHELAWRRQFDPAPPLPATTDDDREDECSACGGGFGTFGQGDALCLACSEEA